MRTYNKVIPHSMNLIYFYKNLLLFLKIVNINAGDFSPKLETKLITLTDWFTFLSSVYTSDNQNILIKRFYFICLVFAVF